MMFSIFIFTALPNPQVTILTGGSVTAGTNTSFLRCSVQSIPHQAVGLTIAWTRLEDSTSQRISLGSNPQLHLRPLRTSDSGQYTCTVTIVINDETSVSGEASIDLVVDSE